MERTKRRYSFPRKTGFTLVELLVVITILSVLAAMLLPSMQQAMITAKQIDCQNRMRQFMFVAHEYESDYRVFLPGFQSWPGFGGIMGLASLVHGGYIDEINRMNAYDYSGVKKVNTTLRAQSFILCPSGIFRGLADRSTTGDDNLIRHGNKDGNGGVFFDDDTYDKLDGSTTWLFPDGFCFSYCINSGKTGYNLDKTKGFQYNSNDAWDYRCFRTIRSFPQPPSKKMYLFEARGCYRGYIGNGGFGLPRDYDSACRHGDLSNYACYDGHVGAYGRDILECGSLYSGNIEAALEGDLCF